MTLVAIKKGNKTIYRNIEKMDKYEQKKERDLTTSGAKLISFSDVSDLDWNRIFKRKKS